MGFILFMLIVILSGYVSLLSLSFCSLHVLLIRLQQLVTSSCKYKVEVIFEYLLLTIQTQNTIIKCYIVL